MFKRLFSAWKERQAERSRVNAIENSKREERLVQIEWSFKRFLLETESLMPKATKHKAAALYRHAWKRAVVLEVLFDRSSDPGSSTMYKEFQERAAAQYYKVAPETLYGKPKLKLAPDAGARLLTEERDRLLPKEIQKSRDRVDACVYMGFCPEGRPYIGQTVLFPENRWLQHKLEKTGPFKKGAQYVSWRVLEGPVSPSQLNACESYFIGFYDSYSNGHNDTRGNDLDSYLKGQAERVK